LSEVELWAVWEKGFAALFQTLDSLNEGDFSVIVYIRKEPHSVPEALLRSLSHIAYHVGQIVYIAKNIQAHEWKNLSIPKGESEAFSFTAKKKKK
jgi:hypothetical protein